MNIFFGGLQQSFTVMVVKHFPMNNSNLNMQWSTVYFLTFLLVREILSQRPRENNFFIKVLFNLLLNSLPLVKKEHFLWSTVENPSCPVGQFLNGGKGDKKICGGFI